MPGTTSVTSTLSINWTCLGQTQNYVETGAIGYGIDVKHFYLGVDHGFDHIWAMNLTTDLNYTNATGETQLFVKNAYVQARLDQSATFRLGAAAMPWISFDEAIYGYRFVEKL